MEEPDLCRTCGQRLDVTDSDWTNRHTPVFTGPAEDGNVYAWCTAPECAEASPSRLYDPDDDGERRRAAWRIVHTEPSPGPSTPHACAPYLPPGTTPTANSAGAILEELDLLAVTMARHRARTATYVIARTIRDQHPQAARVLLAQPGPGRPLRAAAWTAPELDWNDLPYSVQRTLPTVDGQYALVVPGLSTENAIDIDRALAGYRPPVVAETFTTDCPSAGPDTYVTVLGHALRHVTVAETAFDGVEQRTWEEYTEQRDYCLTGASAVMRAQMLRVFSDPPGRGNVERPVDVHSWLGNLDPDQDDDADDDEGA